MGFHQPFFFCYLLLVIKSDLFSKKVNASESNSDKKGKKKFPPCQPCYVCVCEKSGRIDTRAGGNYGRDIPLSRDRLSNSLHPALWCCRHGAPRGAL